MSKPTLTLRTVLFSCTLAALMALAPAAARAADTVSPPRFATETDKEAAANSTSNTTVAKQAIIVDYDTGMVLFEKDADTRLPTASMSKVMTMYMVFEALKEGKLNMDDKLMVSEKAWRMGGSKMFVKVGDRVLVEDLVRGVLVQSGNDATIVLAEGVRGTEEAFAEAATARAKQLGMKNSNFMNASGWPDPNHYSTPRDLAVLAYSMIRDFPDHYRYFSIMDFTYNNIKQGNRNPLLYRDIGADGMKTGHTEEAGYGLIGSAVGKDGRRVIMVVSGMGSANERAQEATRLIEWSQKSFENVTLFKAGQPVEQAAVVMGQKQAVPLALAQDLKVTIPLSMRNDLKVSATYDTPLMAPVKKGQQVGTLSVEIPRMSGMTLPLYAAEDVGHLGFFAAALAKAKLLIGGGPRVP